MYDTIVMNYALPSIVTCHELNDNICYETRCLNHISSTINLTLASYINIAKEQIDNRQSDWELFKKYTNPYEYIHTALPNSKLSVCKLNPISRSFYKMIEICETLDICSCVSNDKCKTFHFAEGPGGFIEAINYLRENSKDEYYGMTLLNEYSSTVPGWKKSDSFLKKNKNVVIWSGVSGNGDLLNADNLLDCYNNHKMSCDIVTGDGGFDFTPDFKHQETISLKLTFAQCAFAMATQKTGGNFVIKFFDTYTQASIDLLYILSNVYEKIYIIKPNTSRQANSEKYIVCKNFKLTNSLHIVNAMYIIIKSFDKHTHPYRFVNCDIPYNFICGIQEVNAIIGQAQLENIYTTLNLIDTYNKGKLENLKNKHISKCISWCQKFILPYNKILLTSNIFENECESSKDCESNY